MGALCGTLFGSSQTTTYSPPAAVTGAVTDILNRAATQSNQPYPQYTPDTAAQYMNYVPGLVAPMTPNQVYAGQSISGLQGYTDPNFAAATALTSNAATPIQMQQYTPEAVNQYMNPYMNDVVNSAVSNINQTNAQQQQQVLGNTIQRGAFGGDRAGIAQAELARQQDLANNATIANLLNQGYNQAQGLFTQQQGQDLTTQLQNRNLLNTGAINLANLGTQGQQAALQQAQAQYGYGTGEQQQQQAALSTAYQQYMNQQAFPYQQLSYYAGLASGAAPAMGGSTTGYTPTVAPATGVLGAYSTLNSLSNAATGGSGGFLSGLVNTLGPLFAKGGRINYDAGGRAKYATDGRVPTDQSIIQAYNDYVNLISSGRASKQQVDAAYKRYQEAFQNAPLPWEKAQTTATTTDTATTTAPKTNTTPVADVSNIGRAGDKIGGGKIGGGNDSSVSPIYGGNGNIVGRGSLSGPGASGGPTDEYGINPRAGDTPGFGTPGAGGGYGINQQKGILSGLIGGVDPTTGAQTGIAGAINALVKGNSPGSLNAVLNAPNTVAYGKRADNSAYPNTSTGMTAQEWADKFADGDISKVSGSVVNGQIDWFRNDNAVANAVHPGALPASQLSGVIGNVSQPEQTDTSGITDPLAGGADLGATKSAGILGNPYKGMTKEQFIAAISPMAEQVAQQTGLTPQTIMAQTAEETGWGQHMVGNNLFNIKGTDIPNVTTTENIPGEGNVKTLASFAAYENPQKAFDAYGKLMSTNPRYAGVIGATDTNAQIDALGKSRYATDSDYGQNVKSFADAIAKMNIAPPEAKEDYSINTPKGVISSDSSSEPSSGIGAANEGHGGGGGGLDRTVSAPDNSSNESGSSLGERGNGPSVKDSSEGDHVAGVKEESQAEHDEKRGGRIHKYAAGGYAPISMQYGLPTQEDLAQKYSDFAGTGVGQLSAQELAMAAKGILPAAAKGGRIGYANLPDGSGAVKSDDDYNLAGNPDLNSNSMWSEDTDTSYLPIEKEDPDIFKRISRALYPKGPLSMAVGSSAKYTMPDAGLRIGKEGQPAITTVPVNEEDMDRAYKVGKTVQQRMAESPSDVAKRVTDELAARPTSASGTYTQSYDVYPNRPDEGGGSIKTSPIIPKSTDNGPDSVVSKFLTTDDEIPSSSTTQSAPTTRKKGVEVAQDTTRTQSDAPQPGFGYVAPNPADMRNFYGLTYGLSLLSGSSIAAAGDTYAKNILAQQAEQRAQMEAQGRTAQSYGSAESSQATAGKTRAEETNMLIKPSFFGDYALVLSPNPENPSFKTIPMPGMDQSQIPAPSTGLGDAADSALDQYSKDFKRTNGARFLLKPDDAVNYKNDFMQEQKELSKAAGAANSSLGDVRTMAEALTEAGGSPVGMGAGARFANSIRRQAYGLARAFGYNGPEPGDDPVIAQQELDKISQFLANAQVGAITHNGAARLVEANRSVQPNVDLEFGTASRLFSGTARQNVMLRDYQKVLNAYGKRTANTGTDVQQVYQDAMPADRYNREQAVLESLVQPDMTDKDNDGKSQNMVTYLLNNKITKNQFDAIISKKYPDVKNLSRWLVN